LRREIVYITQPQGYLIDLVRDVFDGEKFPGGFGKSRSFAHIDYFELRKKSNQLFTENPYAKGIIRRLVTNEVGSGLNLEAAPVNDILGLTEEAAQIWADNQETNWRLWSDIDYICDYKEQDTLGELAAKCRRESLIGGDVLVVLRINPKTKLPNIELIDGVHIRTPMKSDTKNEIRHGVEIDKRGRHIAYYVQTDVFGEYKRIPAWGEKSGRRLAWLVYGCELRLDEVRGQPLLACMLYMLKELDRYRDSESRAAVVNSLMPMFIKKGAPGVSTRAIDGGATLRGSTNLPQTDGSTKKWNWGNMLPGTVPQSLAEGEEPVSFNTQRPNAGYTAFEEAIINVLSWVSEIPPEVTRLLFQNNYSASRQANNELNIYLVFRHKKFGNDFYQPIYVEHLIQSVLIGDVKAAGFIDAWWYEKNWRIFGAWTNAEWTGTSRPSVDIAKDVKAAVEMIDSMLTTRDQQCRKLSGMSYKTILQKQKREMEAAERIGIELKSDKENDVVIPDDVQAKLKELISECIIDSDFIEDIKKEIELQ